VFFAAFCWLLSPRIIAELQGALRDSQKPADGRSSEAGITTRFFKTPPGGRASPVRSRIFEESLAFAPIQFSADGASYRLFHVLPKFFLARFVVRRWSLAHRIRHRGEFAPKLREIVQRSWQSFRASRRASRGSHAGFRDRHPKAATAARKRLIAASLASISSASRRRLSAGVSSGFSASFRR